MSGKLVVACPQGAGTPPFHSSHMCYFILMRYPSLCSALAEGHAADASTVHERGDADETANTNRATEMKKNGVMVITVDTVSGQLLHAGIPQRDLFFSMTEAMHAIPALCPRTPHSFEVRTVVEFLAFAGGCLSEEFIHLLFIEASTLLLGGRGATPYPYATGEYSSHLEDSSMKGCIPPIYAVKKAEWYRIPLQITVPALQHSLTINEIHSRTHNSRCRAPLTSLNGLTAGSEPPYLYYSPGIDITHCSIFKEAVTHCATINQTYDNTTQDNTLKSRRETVFYHSLQSDMFLPPLPKRTGRDALGRCDCLWNEELIVFCEVFALGKYCCRLALGSCSATPLSHPFGDSSMALLIVRISRLAMHGCFYDYTVESTKILFEDYVSTLETEFQLFILRRRHGGTFPEAKERVKPISSLTWRRGTDFVNSKDIIEQQRRFDDYAKRFIDPLPSQEDHVAGIFFGYLERYGPGTGIILAHAGSATWCGKSMVSDAYYSSATSISNNNTSGNIALARLSPRCSAGGGSPARKQFFSYPSSPSSQPTSILSSSKKLPHSLSHFFSFSLDQHDEIEGVSEEVVTVDKNLQLSLESLAAHVRGHALKPSVAIGDLCYNPPQESTSKNGGFHNEEIFLHTFWGGETMRSSREELMDNWIPRVCVADDTETSIVASIIVSLGWIVGWLCCQVDEPVEEQQFLLEHEVLVENMITLLLNSAAGTPRTGVISRVKEVIASVWGCLVDIYTSRAKKGALTNKAFSVVVWMEAQRIVRLAEASEKSSLNTNVALVNAGDSPHSVSTEKVPSFLARFFLPVGRFYPREYMRDRIVLLTHPSKLSFVIGAHLMFPHSERECSSSTLGDATSGLLHERDSSSNLLRRRLFPFTPLRSLNLPVYCTDTPSVIVTPSQAVNTTTTTTATSTNDNSSTASTLTVGMFRGLTHPFSQPLLIPACFNKVEFTVALPSRSHVTHIALAVADAVQRASYAAPLSLSLTTCCYVGQAHTRAVLEDVSLPLCISSRSSQSGHAAPRLIFYALHSSTPGGGYTSELELNSEVGGCGYLFNSTAPVIARFLHFSFQGSGCNAMALPPVLVFGKPLDSLPDDEGQSFIPRRTGLVGVPRTPIPPFLRASQAEKVENLPAVKDTPSRCTEYHTTPSMNNFNTLDNPSSIETGNSISPDAPCHVSLAASTQRRCEMYVHKLSSAIPAEIFQLTLGITLQVESKRQQCHVRRYYRDWCLHRIGLPRWVMNPMSQVFPHSAVYRSRLPEETEDFIRIREHQEENFHRQMETHSKTNKIKVKREERRHCTICKRKFSWFFAAKECNRCQRQACQKCFHDTLVSLPELGLHETNYRICLKCVHNCETLEGIMESFHWSECNDDVSSEGESEEAIAFFAGRTVPQLSRALFLCGSMWWGSIQRCSLSADNTPYQLTMHPYTRVVSAPGMDERATPLFEEVLGVAGVLQNHSSGSLASWRCVMDEECTDSTTRVSRHVVLLLPQEAVVSHGVLHYTLTGKLRGDVEVQLLVGNSLHGLHVFHSTPIHSYDVHEQDGNEINREVRVLQLHDQREEQVQGTRLSFDDQDDENEKAKDTSMPKVYGAVVLASLFFYGAVSDLARLRVKHFSLWGRFVLVTPDIHTAYHMCKPDLSQYGSLNGITAYCTRGMISLACLPRMLPMTRLIPLRSVIPHTNTEQLLLEFDFGIPTTVCGFVLELHHPVMMNTTQFGIATALRLIGVSASGFRGNIGSFVLPWPPLPVLDITPHEIFAYAYSLPSTNYDLLSVLVEVVEWRCTNPTVAAAAIVRREKKKKIWTEKYRSGERVFTAETESSLRRGVYLGKLHFWTSTNAATRRMVSGHMYTSIHAAVADIGTRH